MKSFGFASRTNPVVAYRLSFTYRSKVLFASAAVFMDRD
jgi:hypothetical protein